MEKRNRIFAFIMAVLLIATLLFSCTFILEKAHHDCTGDNCPICMEIKAAMQTISGFKALPVLAFVVSVLCVFTQAYTVKTHSDSVRNTLITLKVELLT